MKRTGFHVAVAVGAALALAGLTGCGAGQQDGARGQPSASVSPSGAPSSAMPSPPSSRASPTAGKDGTVELEGTVEAGVEAGCLILTAHGKVYNLIGGDRSVLKAGNQVVVRGTAEPGMMTTCQQGIPFRVDDAQKR